VAQDRDWVTAAEEELVAAIRGLGVAAQEALEAKDGAETKVRTLRSAVEALSEVVGVAGLGGGDE
jgi:hypothetical protein